MNESPDKQPEITELLKAARNGDRKAADTLFEIVYEELRRRAHKYFNNERSNHTLQATALVNEAWIKLFSGEPFESKDREHFFYTAAQAMRRVLVDHARMKNAEKREGEKDKISIDDLTSRDKVLYELREKENIDVLKLHEALEKLAEIDKRQSIIVEQKFFGGYTVEEIAENLNLSPATIKNEWRHAKAWLLTEMEN